jgi:hypothetical protein
MRTVVRLAQSGSTWDRRLVLAARGDRPPPGAEDAALAILEMQAALTAGDACAARSTRHAKALAGKLGGLKLLLALVAVSGAGMVGWSVAHRAAGTGRAPSVAPISAATVREGPSIGWPAVDRSAVAEAVAAARAEPRGPSAVPAATGKALRASPRRALSQDASDLALEVALVQRAAQAVGAGDADGALAALDEASRRCKHPVLVQEAGLLRSRALAMGGQTPEAAALARRLLEADPHGVLASRFGAIADAGAAP